MRVAAGGLQFFISEDWLWALVDVVIVLGALLDVVLDILEAVQATGSEMLSGIDGVSSLKVLGQCLRSIFRCHFESMLASR